jgi:hypothetical protein
MLVNVRSTSKPGESNGHGFEGWLEDWRSSGEGQGRASKQRT